MLTGLSFYSWYRKHYNISSYNEAGEANQGKSSHTAISSAKRWILSEYFDIHGTYQLNIFSICFDIFLFQINLFTPNFNAVFVLKGLLKLPKFYTLLNLDLPPGRGEHSNTLIMGFLGQRTCGSPKVLVTWCQ